MVDRLRYRLNLPDPDRLAVGAGILAAAVLVGLPGIAGFLDWNVSIAVDPGELIADAVPLGAVLVAAAVLLAVVGIVDLAGRTELRQGAAIVALGGGAVVGLMLALALRDALEASVSDRSAELVLVPAYTFVVWGCALALGTVAFGPTRSASIIGLVTFAIVLLLPSGPDGKPFASWYVSSGPEALLLSAGIGIAAVWRLLDLPFVGGIVLGLALLVGTLYLIARLEAPTVAAGEGMLPAGDLLAMVYAAGLWVALGAIFGRPPSEA